MDEKLSFVVAYLRGEWSMAALCEEYGISRKTGYKWVARYRRDGLEGLVGRSRAPRRHARTMAPEVVEAIIERCRGRPRWGPRKLHAVLMDERPDVVWPAASTMGDLLRAEGLGGRASASPSCGGAVPPVPRGARSERRVEHRLQGVVPHPRRHALRSFDDHGCLPAGIFWPA